MPSLTNYDPFRIETADQMPTTRHWAILLFHSKSYNDSGYSEAEGGSATIHNHSVYYAFPQKSEWQSMIEFLTTARSYSLPNGASFVAFEASGKAKLSINVQVNVDSNL